MAKTWMQCEESACGQLFHPKEPGQRFCSRRCARLYQARHGLPSYEDKKALLLQALTQKIDELFGEEPKNGRKR